MIEDWLRAMAQKRQWPSRATVGRAGVHAAWLIAQRATIHSVTPMRSSLEDLFMAAAEGSAFQAPARREA